MPQCMTFQSEDSFRISWAQIECEHTKEVRPSREDCPSLGALQTLFKGSSISGCCCGAEANSDRDCLQ